MRCLGRSLSSCARSRSRLPRYWGALDLLRKLTLVGFGVLLSALSNTPVRALSLSAIAMFWFCVQLYLAPFRQAEDNLQQCACDMGILIAIQAMMFVELSAQDGHAATLSPHGDGVLTNVLDAALFVVVPLVSICAACVKCMRRYAAHSIQLRRQAPAICAIHRPAIGCALGV